MKKLALLSLFSLLIGSKFLHAQEATGILVIPGKLEFGLDKGKNEVKTITISNNLKEPLQFKLYLGDWLRDSIGGHKYMAPATNSFSCARWISLDQEFVELQPGEKKLVSVKVNVPDSVTAIDAMRWAMIFVETAKETKAQTTDGFTTKMTNNLRMGIHVYQTPPTVTNKDFRMIGFNGNDTSARMFEILCKNTGAVQIECKSYIEAVNLETGIKTKISFPDFPMFPGQTRKVPFRLPESLPKGKYNLIGAVDAGEDLPLEAAQKTIEIK